MNTNEMSKCIDLVKYLKENIKNTRKTAALTRLADATLTEPDLTYQMFIDKLQANSEVWMLVESLVPAFEEAQANAEETPQQPTNSVVNIENFNKLLKKYDSAKRGLFCDSNKLAEVLLSKGLEEGQEQLETGLLYFLKETIEELKQVSREAQFNEDRNIGRFYNTIKKDDEGNCKLLVLRDPLGDYKFTEKRELELEKFYEDKILNNREKEERRIEEAKLTKNEPKKKKQFNEDSEILKTISKMKLDKAKDVESTTKQAEDMNQAIQFFVQGPGNEKDNRDGLLGKRDEIGADGLKIKKNGVHVSHKHLIFYLENNLRYKKSRHLLSAYMKQ